VGTQCRIYGWEIGEVIYGWEIGEVIYGWEIGEVICNFVSFSFH
jgi:hypothetical protein